MTPVFESQSQPIWKPLPNIHTPPLAEALVDTLLGTWTHLLRLHTPPPRRQGKDPWMATLFLLGKQLN